ncbi:MAG: MBL fold metallo-hydrolase [Candidatus Dormibacteria bacterium]
MEITYHGLSCFRLRGRDCQVVLDPPQDSLSGLGKLKADIVVRTDGELQPERLRPREGEAQEVSGPGEFEVRGVAVNGLPAGDTTIVRLDIDDVRVAVLGRLNRQLTEEEVDELGRIDVLVVPVGGVDALGATAATKLVNAVSPAIVIPARYRSPIVAGSGGYEPVEKFAKEMGLAEDAWAPQPKLSLSGSLAGADDTRLVVLEPRG